MAGVGRIPSRLLELFSALDRAGINWCLLRPRGLLAQAEGDVDILVAEPDLERAAEVLAGQDFLSMPGAVGDRHGVDRDDETGRFLWVHVQTTVVLAGIIVAAPEVLATSQASPAMPAADRPPDAQLAGAAPEQAIVREAADPWLFWILAIRGLVDKGTIPERHRPHLRSLSSAAAAAPERLLSLAGAAGLDPGEVGRLCAAADWGRLLRLRPGPIDARPPLSATLRRAARLLPRVREMLSSRCGARAGISVAILGPDGAGKTTLVGSLETSLPIPTRVVYLGLTGGHIHRADRLRLPGVVFAARVVVLWSRYLRGSYHRWRGRVVLFERYVLDAAVPSGMHLRPIATVSRRLQQWVLPLPDLVLLLDASGSTLYRRSQEYDAERLEQWRVAFRRLERSVSQLETLDAERPASAVLQDAEARIWASYRAAAGEASRAGGRRRSAADPQVSQEARPDRFGPARGRH
jgi:thymidylate kinase